MQSHVSKVYACLPAATCHLHFLAEWAGCFTCCGRNTGVERIANRNKESTQKDDPGEEISLAAAARTLPGNASFVLVSPLYLILAHSYPSIIWMHMVCPLQWRTWCMWYVLCSEGHDACGMSSAMKDMMHVVCPLQRKTWCIWYVLCNEGRDSCGMSSEVKDMMHERHDACGMSSEVKDMMRMVCPSQWRTRCMWYVLCSEGHDACAMSFAIKGVLSSYTALI